jgi:exosortase D (VPLPA-CTERM-specific)
VSEERTIVEAALPARRTLLASGWPCLVLAASVAVLYLPVLRLLVAQWWDDPNYSHGFLIPLFAAYVIWERRERLRQVVEGGSAGLKPGDSRAPHEGPLGPATQTGAKARPIQSFSFTGLKPGASTQGRTRNGEVTGFFVLLASLALLFLGLLGAELFLARISLVGVLLGLVLLLWGWPMARALAFPLAVLLLMIPWPTIVYNQLVFPLQLLASRLAAGTLQSFHILPVLREGNVLILPNATLEVAEACSGIRSLMSLLAFSIMYGYIAENRTGLRWLLCVAVVPVAVFSNAVRVMFAAVGSRYWGEEVVEGWPHLLSGIVLFVVAMAAMIGFHCLIRALARIRKDTEDAAEVAPASGRLSVRASRTHQMARTAGGDGDAPGTAGRRPALQPRLWFAVSILALAAVGTHTMRHGEVMPLRQSLQNIPLRIEGWQGADDPLDEKTVAMTGVDEYLNRAYIRGDDFLGLYIGYYRTQATGDTIHSPKNCLPGSGWQPVSSSLVELQAPDGRQVPVNSYVIQKGAERQVVLYWYQSHGRVMASEYQAKFYMIADALRWNRTDGALVRIAAPVGNDEEQTREQAVRFAQQVLPRLNGLLP